MDHALLFMFFFVPIFIVSFDFLSQLAPSSSSFLIYHLHVGLTVVGNQLIAIGGFDGASYLKSVEVYDPEAACWRVQGNMNSRRLGGGVGVVRMASFSRPGDYLYDVDSFERISNALSLSTTASSPTAVVTSARTGL
ncbi:unnamed protein product, partial [Dibothriocephalus latus]